MSIRQTLTLDAIQQIKPRLVQYEIPEGTVPGLRLVIYPTGTWSWVMRFHKPGKKNTTSKLTLGRADLTGAEATTEPTIGGHLTLAAARRLAAEVNRQRALGRAPAACRVVSVSTSILIAEITKRVSDELNGTDVDVFNWEEDQDVVTK